MAGRRLRVGTVALLLGLSTFGLFSVTTEPLASSGYEIETAAVSEGLVRAGQPRVLDHSALGPSGLVGREGRYYGRAGLTQPVLEAPFYWVGEKLDDISSNGRNDRWRLTLLQLFDPAMAALTVVAIFALLLLRGVTARLSLLIAGLCAIATLIWPYSKIGMDTTLMTLMALTVLAAAWAARRPSAGRLALLGASASMAMNSKAYGALLALGALPLLASPLRRVARERRVGALAALAAPVLLGLAAAAWYNWYRTGSVTNFDDAYITQRLFAMPFSAIGLLLSPGKGLVFYSPLVVLGLLGLREMWSADRPLARTIVLTASLNVLFVSTSLAWTDETWGPRYIVPSAWLLVLPIAWWLTTRRRRRWLAAFAAAAACIQFVGVFAWYGETVQANRTLAGEPVYLYGDVGARVAYGDDGPRWIPQASPLLFQTELTLAYVKEKLTGTGFYVTYWPWRGNEATLDLTHPAQTFGLLPDFWWKAGGVTTKQDLLAVLLGLLSVGSGAILLSNASSRRSRQRLRATVTWIPELLAPKDPPAMHHQPRG